MFFWAGARGEHARKWGAPFRGARRDGRRGAAGCIWGDGGGGGLAVLACLQLPCRRGCRGRCAPAVSFRLAWIRWRRACGGSDGGDEALASLPRPARAGTSSVRDRSGLLAQRSQQQEGVRWSSEWYGVGRLAGCVAGDGKNVLHAGLQTESIFYFFVEI